VNTNPETKIGNTRTPEGYAPELFYRTSVLYRGDPLWASREGSVGRLEPSPDGSWIKEIGGCDAAGAWFDAWPNHEDLASDDPRADLFRRAVAEIPPCQECGRAWIDHAPEQRLACIQAPIIRGLQYPYR